ncbi:MAG: hypothetical protein GEU26_18080 [Nitrososphaeraceae archaeon]|nr:hypothetical protein [Nitrososphaeraceae archaeon]
MNYKIIFAAVAAVIIGIGVLSYFLYWYSYSQAKDILSGVSECGKNIQFNDVKTEECYNRIPEEGDFYGPHFTLQNMSYNDPINEDIYSYMSYEDLVFWAEQPEEVFELNVDLIIPVKPEDSVPSLAVGEEIILPVRGYFFTEYMAVGNRNNTILNSYIGSGQVQIGGNYWYQVPAVYQTWNNGYSYEIMIGTYRWTNVLDS